MSQNQSRYKNCVLLCLLNKEIMTMAARSQPTKPTVHVSIYLSSLPHTPLDLISPFPSFVISPIKLSIKNPHMPISTQDNHRHYLTRSHKRLLFFFLKCIIMFAVISIFLFFLGFAAFVLLHFLFVPRTFNRRCNRHTSAESPPQLLPDVMYSEAAFPRLPDCAICLDSFEDGDVCRDLPVCKHLFHARCVDRWIHKKPTCPVCRTRVDLESPGSRTSGDDPWKRLWVVNSQEGTSY